MVRDVYLLPPPELKLDDTKLLKLCKPFYGLADGGDYKGRTLRAHLIQEIGLTATISDRTFFFIQDTFNLVGMCAVYVDDMLHGG